MGSAEKRQFDGVPSLFEFVLLLYHDAPGFGRGNKIFNILRKKRAAMRLAFRQSKNTFSHANVGAIIARPPKNSVFRIIRREITLFSPCGDGFCFGKIHGRPRVAPTGTFLTSSGDGIAVPVFSSQLSDLFRRRIAPDQGGIENHTLCIS